MNKALLKILFLLSSILLMTSCIYSEIEEPDEIPSASETSELSMEVSFRPLGDVITRSAGDVIKHVDRLWVLAYGEDGKLRTKVQVYDGNAEGNKYSYSSSELSSSLIPGAAEAQYCNSTFKLALPLGEYRIYAVANYDLASFTGTEDELKAIRLVWNGSDIASNNPMFGFFTDNETGEVPSEVPVISVNKKTGSLHAWVKRAASKVTVTYDASELKDNIYIYLKSVQILDIPKYCPLGNSNTPASSSALIHEGEMLTYSSSPTVQDWPYVSKGNPVYQYGGGHTETAQALYFFENNQGTGSKHGYHPGDASWDKDQKAYGTYIEVKGYYVNRTADNSSQGPIIYRFMLGKDVTSDFNAERSNHYKVTLKFRNNANDPDWHIVYEPEQPEITIPDPLYISYVPNESVNVPVVVRGGSYSTTVKADIIESHWYGDKGHKYAYTFTDVGILSLAKTENGTATTSVSGVKPSQVLTDRCLYSIPIYTRGLSLGSSFSGYNYFPHDTRTGTVRFSVTVNGKTYTKDV